MAAAITPPFQPDSFSRAAQALEKPPRHPVLRADHGGVRAQYRAQLRRQLRQAVRLDGEEDHVHRPDFFQGGGHFGTRFKISFGALHPHSVLSHGTQMRSTRE